MIVIFIKVAVKKKVTMLSGKTTVPMARDGIAIIIPANRVMTSAALPWVIVLRVMVDLIMTTTKDIGSSVGAQILDKLRGHTSQYH